MEWLSQLVEAVLRIFPRIGLCKCTEGGVKFLPRGKTKTITPGLYFFWPLVSKVEIITTAQHSVDISCQSLTTRDNVSVTVNAVLVLKVTNVRKAIELTASVYDTVGSIAGAALVDSVTSRTYDQLRSGLTTEVWPEFTAKARKLLKPYGVRVLDGYTTDFSRGYVLRLLGGNL